MLKRRLLAIALFLFAGWALLSGGTTARADVTSTIPLHASQVGSVNDGKCGQGQFGWHFVLPGNSANFVSLTVTFQNAGTVTSFVSVQNGKGADVLTPTADTLLSGSAVITGTTPQGYFNLSDVYCGSGSTPTPTPSSTPTLSEGTPTPGTPTPTPSESTPTPTPSDPATPTPTATPTPSSTPTPTPTPVSTPTSTPTPPVPTVTVPDTGAGDRGQFSKILFGLILMAIGVMIWERVLGVHKDDA